MKINFKIITPEKIVYEDEVDQATMPVSDGEITILPNHRSYIASLKPGEIRLKMGKNEKFLATSGGFIEFNKNTLVVLADTAERASEIDLQRAEETARKRAEELKKEKVAMSEIEYARIASLIEKELARVKVAKKHRSRQGMKIN
ncbi:MAG TPA: ATP synthase F1 subunit epsilon [Candidatus Moranbacteria bacterium]|nr:ATP synthase F1 subunit epsilon [Candidatus Moranbacteria bacterium]HRZ33428.1 ATP synthase F1 subunit epsilon [Candidatus Moranbacteria bacterium]